jgi:hypothetical protein
MTIPRRGCTAILLTALVYACGPLEPEPCPTTYRATADASGWATVRCEGYGEGVLLDVDAWAVEQCDGCDPLYHPVVHELLPDGYIRAMAAPGVEVVFTVVVMGDGAVLEERTGDHPSQAPSHRP